MSILQRLFRMWGHLSGRETMAAIEADLARRTAEAKALDVREQEIMAQGGTLADKLHSLQAELHPARAIAAESFALESSLRHVELALDQTVQQLNHVSRIGVWSKSDDCSDNRNKRNGLRDAASDAWSAGQNLEKAQRQFPELQDALEPLRLDINALHHSLKSLADIMGKNPRLDHEIDKNHSRAKELLARLAPILEMYRGRATHDSERVKALEATRRSLLENSEQQPAIQNGTT